MAVEPPPFLSISPLYSWLLSFSWTPLYLSSFFVSPAFPKSMTKSR